MKNMEEGKILEIQVIRNKKQYKRECEMKRKRMRKEKWEEIKERGQTKVDEEKMKTKKH